MIADTSNFTLGGDEKAENIEIFNNNTITLKYQEQELTIPASRHGVEIIFTGKNNRHIHFGTGDQFIDIIYNMMFLKSEKVYGVNP